MVKRYKWKRSRSKSSSRYDHITTKIACWRQSTPITHSRQFNKKNRNAQINDGWLIVRQSETVEIEMRVSFEWIAARESKSLILLYSHCWSSGFFIPLTLLLCDCVSESVCMYLSCNCCCSVDVALLNSLICVSFCLYSQSHSQG